VTNALPAITVSRWQSHEVVLESAKARSNPFDQVEVRGVLTAPDGRVWSVPGFWDGAATWRIRISPDAVGTWRWASTCSDPGDTGLHGREGWFECTAYDGDLEIYRHGPIQVSGDGRRFIYADGTPFFWLGDTCWNGVLRSSVADWDRYLDTRRRQGFNVIHHFSMTWRGLPTGRDGRRAFTREGGLRVDPAFFQPLDDRILALNRHGFVAAPIIVLALYDEDEGWSLPESDLTRLARYLLARWNSYQVVWSLGGDGDFTGKRARRWRSVGAALASDRRGRLMSMHPKGLSWDADDFRQESWFDFVEYQSCHFASPEAIAWMTTGPLPDAWQSQPTRPILNVEPNYEEHPALDTGRIFDDRDVRRASWWSVLLSPTVGVTYGDFHVWSWSDRGEDFRTTLRDGSSGWTSIGPWHDHLETAGVRSLCHLRNYFESGAWYGLEPAPRVLARQPGEIDPLSHQAAAATTMLDWAVVYVPGGQGVYLADTHRWTLARWYDPRDGSWRAATLENGGALPPDRRDWILDLRA